MPNKSDFAMNLSTPHVYRLSIACPDKVGIVGKVSSFIALYGGNITEANHHLDQDAGWFFMRTEIEAASMPFDVEQFRTAFEPIAREFSMQWSISDSAQKKRIVLLVSHEAHCLHDLLYRWKAGELDGDIVGIVANHQVLGEMAGWYNIPFFYIPISKDNKAEAFAAYEAQIDALNADVIVLARFMQIMPPSLCERYLGRMINIHHSFLPSFIGAKPYHQAFQRGVKLIGATCHYVTQDLDEGPIIEQDVIRVTHRHSIEDLQRLGRDVERNVLARGLIYHLEDRVMIHGHKTVVLLEG